MPNNKNSSVLKAIRLTWSLMTNAERKKGALISILSITNSFFETIALISVMPLVSLIINPEILNNNEMLKEIHSLLNYPEYDLFVKIAAFFSISLISFSVCMNYFVMVVTKNYRITCQNRLAKKIISHCLNAPYVWLVRKNSSVLSHHVFNDVLGWSSGGIHGVMAIIGHISLLILISIVILSTAKFSGAAGLLIVGSFAAIVVYFIRPHIKHLSIFRRDAAAKSYSFVSEILRGIKDVKLSSREEKFIKIYGETFNRYGNAMGTLKLIQALPPLLMLFFGQISIILIALFLWSLDKSSGEIATEMALVLLITARAIPVITKLSTEISTLWSVIPNVEGINSVFDEKFADSSNLDKSKKIEVMNKFKNWKNIQINNVIFHYSPNTNPVLQDINAIIEKGKSYGIVGPTGAGKTTFVDIILGLIQATSGEVNINGDDLNLENSRIWQQQIGYVPQNPLITDDTLQANIAFGVADNQVNIDHVLNCIEMANIKDVLETITLSGSLGDNGNRLSGGQKQRVAIARALYNSPEILVMDEATSSLDSISERSIQLSLDNLKGKVTTITIAHRLSTIENCDTIYVIDNGKLIASGNYKTLVNDCMLFKEMALSSSNPTDK